MLLIRQDIDQTEVPMEYICQARSYLDAAEKLNSLMCDSEWSATFNRGRVVMWLTFHATELYLKGLVLKLDVGAKVGGHSLASLTETLNGLCPSAKCDPPFGVEPLPPGSGLAEEAAQIERRFHEMLRYPTNKTGDIWEGVHSFSPHTFAAVVETTRSSYERLFSQIFVDKCQQ